MLLLFALLFFALGIAGIVTTFVIPMVEIVGITAVFFTIGILLVGIQLILDS
jgi:hypothetical protein